MAAVNEEGLSPIGVWYTQPNGWRRFYVFHKRPPPLAKFKLKLNGESRITNKSTFSSNHGSHHETTTLEVVKVIDENGTQTGANKTTDYYCVLLGR